MRFEFNIQHSTFKILILILPLVVILGCSQSDETPPGTSQDFTILSEDLTTRTLTVAESPYLVTDTIRVLQGATVTVEPGVEIRFGGLHWLKVEGNLQAVGTTSAPITFTSNSSNPDFGDWRNIIFTNPSDQSHMAFCIVEYGASYDTTMPYYAYRGAISVVGGADPIIDHCVIYKNGYNGIYIAENSSPNITHNVIIQNDDNGILCFDSAPVIEYNDCWNNHSRDWVGTPEFVGVDSILNVNLDSCDVFYNISLNPQFVTEGEFVLHSCSPCINAGDTDSPDDPDGTTADLGVFYYPIDASNIRKATSGTLSLANSPFRITCDAFVPAGNSLTIEAGVVIRFEGQYEFAVYGTLLANGSAGDHVVITTNQISPPRGYWTYLRFMPGSEGSVISYCDIDHGKAVTLDSTEIAFDHVVFQEMDEYGLFVHGQTANATIQDCQFWGAGLACISLDSVESSDAEISRSIISGAEGRGISLNYYCAPVISNCVIYGNGTSGIECIYQSDATIVNNTIFGNGYYGVYCQWNSSPVLMNNIVTNNQKYGIRCQYSSVPPISYNDVWNNYLMTPDSTGSNYSDCQPGVGDISGDPGFVDQGGYNFHLTASSPCVNQGNPDPAYNDADGSRNDMGAYGGPEGNW